jgi:hypothetical protein
MPLYIYELKRADGGIVCDERPEDLPNQEAALDYGKQVASELGRNATHSLGAIIVKTDTGNVLAEIPLGQEEEFLSIAS